MIELRHIGTITCVEARQYLAIDSATDTVLGAATVLVDGFSDHGWVVGVELKDKRATGALLRGLKDLFPLVKEYTTYKIRTRRYLRHKLRD
jgi:hypothetical protein